LQSLFFFFFGPADDSLVFVFFFSSRRRHTRYWRDWSSDVCSSDLDGAERQNPLGYFTDAVRIASSGRATRTRFQSAFERWPRYRGPTNMRRLRIVLWLRPSAPRHCVVTHRMGTTTARIISRDP